MAEPIPLHTKTSPVEQQFPVHLQLKESKVRLSCSSDFDKKTSESFQDMMKRMNNRLAQIRTRSRRKHILHCTHAKIIVHVSPVAGWQQAVSSTTWPHLISNSPRQWLDIFVLSDSIKFFHLKMTLGLAFGESWLLLAQPRTNTDVYKGLFPWEGFRYG